MRFQKVDVSTESFLVELMVVYFFLTTVAGKHVRTKALRTIALCKKVFCTRKQEFDTAIMYEWS